MNTKKELIESLAQEIVTMIREDYDGSLDNLIDGDTAAVEDFTTLLSEKLEDYTIIKTAAILE